MASPLAVAPLELLLLLPLELCLLSPLELLLLELLVLSPLERLAGSLELLVLSPLERLAGTLELVGRWSCSRVPDARCGVSPAIEWTTKPSPPPWPFASLSISH